LADNGGQLEPGSFRDRDSRVLLRDGEVLRGLSAEALADWERLSASKLWQRFSAAGRLVKTEPFADSAAVLAEVDTPGQPWVAVLRHEPIPFLSYPYEWCFSMLRDAALLHLELLLAALDEDMILKDATPFNVQFVGTRPVFIDIPSFTQLKPGDVWVGYRQFCELLLYPLMLTAYKGVAFQPWLRGSLDGISPEQFRGLMSWRDWFRKGVLVHVVLHAAIGEQHKGDDVDVRKQIKQAGFRKEMIAINLRKLRAVIGRMQWKPKASTWSDYAGDCHYDEQRREAKRAFVSKAAAARPRGLVWDLGCNTGEYSRLAAEHADRVIAMDGDHLAIERLYLELKAEEHEKILPLLINLAAPTPGLGWRGSERQALQDRGRPDLILALALMHHMIIACHIPLDDWIEWVASLGGDLVLEWVGKDDPMVKKLLRNKDDRYADYSQDNLERALKGHWDIVAREELAGGTRTLYHGARRVADSAAEHLGDDS
jgi:SAM-dependent methyltransferase